MRVIDAPQRLHAMGVTLDTMRMADRWGGPLPLEHGLGGGFVADGYLDGRGYRNFRWVLDPGTVPNLRTGDVILDVNRPGAQFPDVSYTVQDALDATRLVVIRVDTASANDAATYYCFDGVHSFISIHDAPDPAPSPMTWEDFVSDRFSCQIPWSPQYPTASNIATKLALGCLMAAYDAPGWNAGHTFVIDHQHYTKWNYAGCTKFEDMPSACSRGIARLLSGTYFPADDNNARAPRPGWNNGAVPTAVPRVRGFIKVGGASWQM